MASTKKFIFTSFNPYTGSKTETEPMTISEALNYFSYTLDCGASWQHEPGAFKVNRNPKSIKTLLSSLYNASCNVAKNGVGREYSAVEYKGDLK